MAADLDHGYHRWSPKQLTDHESLQETSITQMLAHGSISFGRFAVDSLSWEKRSVFNQNRRLEELEKFKAAGLVAQKKAYFEAYYKRIRALKGLAADDQKTDTSLSQATEDDKTVIPITRTDITGASFERSSTERDIETVNSCSADHVRQLNSEAPESCSYPTSRSFNEFDSNKNIICFDQEADANVRSSDKQSIEYSDDVAFENGLGNTTQTAHALDLSENKSEENIELKSDGASLMHLQANDSTFTPSINLCVTGELKDCDLSSNIKVNLRKSKCNGTSFEPTQSDQTAAVIAEASKRFVYGVPSSHDGPDQVVTTVGKNIEKRSKSFIKEVDSSSRIDTESGRQSKPDSARLLNEPKQMMVERKETISSTVKGMSDGVSACSIEKNEKRTRVTSPCPFSFSTDKRAMTENQPTSFGLTKVVRKNFNHKATDKLASSVSVKAATSFENNVRKTSAAHSTKRRVLVRIRRQEFISTKNSRVDSHLTNVKGRDPYLDRKNNRSKNLSSSDKLHVQSESNSGIVNDSKATKCEGEAVKRISTWKGISESAIPKVEITYRGEVKKEADSSSRIGTESGRQSKPDSARLLNEPKQMMVERKEIISSTVKGMSDGVSACSIEKNEKRTRVTSPCPFSFATDKRAMTENQPTSSGLTKIVRKNFNHKATDKLASSVSVKAATSFENNVRKTSAAHSTKRRVLVRIRRQEFISTKNSRVDSHLTNVKGRDPYLDRKNNRSKNLSSSDKLHVQSESNSGIVNDSKATQCEGEAVKRISTWKGISESAIPKVAITYRGEVKKEVDSSSRIDTKSGRQSKPDSARLLNEPKQMMVERKETISSTVKGMSDGVSACSIEKNEKRTRVTSPCPFSFSTDKRAMTENQPTSIGLTKVVRKNFNHKATDKLASSVSVKAATSFENNVRKTSAAHSTKRRVLVRIRRQKFISTKNSRVDSHLTNVKGRDPYLDRKNNRSKNLSSSDKLHVQSESNSGIVNDSKATKCEGEAVKRISTWKGISESAIPKVAITYRGEVKKEADSSSRIGTESGRQSKPDSARLLNEPKQMMVERKETISSTVKGMSDGVSACSIEKNEKRTRVTSPCPFSFATDKRAMTENQPTSSGLTKVVCKNFNHKATDKLASSVSVKAATSFENNVRKTSAAHSTKRRVLVRIRRQEFISTKNSRVDSHLTNVKGRDPYLDRKNNRSKNLSSSDKLHVQSESNSGIVNDSKATKCEGEAVKRISTWKGISESAIPKVEITYRGEVKKEADSSSRIGTESGRQSKPDSARLLNEPKQMMVERKETISSTVKGMSDGVSACSIEKNEKRTRVTSPCPFSFATDKRAMTENQPTSSGLTKIVRKNFNHKATDKLASSVSVKAATSFENNVRKTSAAHSTKRRVLVRIRRQEFISTKNSRVDSHLTNVKGRDPYLDRKNNRSKNLSSSDKLHVQSESNSGIVNDSKATQCEGEAVKRISTWKGISESAIPKVAITYRGEVKKEVDSSSRIDTKSGRQSKPDSARLLNEPKQMMVERKETISSTVKGMSDGVSACSIEKNEKRTRVTSPCPFSFSPDKRAMTENQPTSIGLTKVVRKNFNHKATDKLASSVSVKAATSFENNVRKTSAAHSTKRRVLVRIRRQEFISTKNSRVDSHLTNVKGRDPYLDRKNNRSKNLSSSDKLHVQSESNSGIVNDSKATKCEGEAVKRISTWKGISESAIPKVAITYRGEVKKEADSSSRIGTESGRQSKPDSARLLNEPKQMMVERKETISSTVKGMSDGVSACSIEKNEKRTRVTSPCPFSFATDKRAMTENQPTSSGLTKVVCKNFNHKATDKLASSVSVKAATSFENNVRKTSAAHSTKRRVLVRIRRQEFISTKNSRVDSHLTNVKGRDPYLDRKNNRSKNLSSSDKLHVQSESNSGIVNDSKATKCEEADSSSRIGTESGRQSKPDSARLLNEPKQMMVERKETISSTVKGMSDGVSACSIEKNEKRTRVTSPCPFSFATDKRAMTENQPTSSGLTKIVRKNFNHKATDKLASSVSVKAATSFENNVRKTSAAHSTKRRVLVRIRRQEFISTKNSRVDSHLTNVKGRDPYLDRKNNRSKNLSSSDKLHVQSESNSGIVNDSKATQCEGEAVKRISTWKGISESAIPKVAITYRGEVKKEADSSSRIGTESGRQSKPDSARLLNEPKQMMVERKETISSTVKGMSDGVSACSIEKNEKRTRVTSPCPFSFATDKRAMTENQPTSSGLTKVVCKNFNHKATDKLASSVSVKAATSFENNVRKTSAAHSTKRRVLVRIRRQEFISTKNSRVDSHLTNVKGRDPYLDRKNNRSKNLSSSDKLHVQSESNSGIVNDSKATKCEGEAVKRIATWKGISELTIPKVAITYKGGVKKEADSSSRIDTESGLQSKPNSARLLNEPKQMMVERKKTISNTVKGMSDGVSACSIEKNEKRSRVTSPCPFSFATDKRAMTENRPTTSGLTKVVRKNFNHKATDKLASSVSVKAATSFENNVRKTAAAHSTERRVLERIRSKNLPSSDKIHLQSESNFRIVNDSKSKKCEGEAVKRISKWKGISESVIPKVARTYRGEVKKDLQVAQHQRQLT